MKTNKPYFVNWITWNRNSPEWKPKHKFQRCRTIEKAERLKRDLLNQSSFIEVSITKSV